MVIIMGALVILVKLLGGEGLIKNSKMTRGWQLSQAVNDALKVVSHYQGGIYLLWYPIIDVLSLRSCE